MDIKFSCQTRPENFTTLSEGRYIRPNKEGKILWFLRNCTPDLSEDTVIKIIQDSFGVWEEQMQPIVFEQTNIESKAEIRITFSSNSQLDDTSFPDPFRPPFPFDDGVLAYAFPPADHSMSSDMWFNEDVNWSKFHSDAEKLVHLKTVIVHEVGHALNIGHSDDRKAIMYPTYAGEMLTLGEDDKLAIQHIYGGVIEKLKKDLGISTQPKEDLEYEAFSKMLKAQLIEEVKSRDFVIATLKEDNSKLKNILASVDEFFGDLIRQKDNILELLDILLSGKFKILFSLGDIKTLAKLIWEELTTNSVDKSEDDLNDFLKGLLKKPNA